MLSTQKVQQFKTMLQARIVECERRAIKTQLMFFRSWRENEFVPPTTFAEPLMKI